MILAGGFITRVEWESLGDLPTVDSYGVLLVSGAFCSIDGLEGPDSNRSAGVVHIVHNVAWNPAQGYRRRVNHNHPCLCRRDQKPRVIGWQHHLTILELTG